MYKHTEASVKMGKDLSNFVNIERGVKQGDSLSPNLFKIHINDLPDIFDDSRHPITLETLCLEPIFWFCNILYKSPSLHTESKAFFRSIKHPNIYRLFVLTYLLVNDLTIENTKFI
jgi:hypothetical protein